MTKSAKAQNAGPIVTVAKPATLMRATVTPTMKISAMDQGRRRSANRNAARAERVDQCGKSRQRQDDDEECDGDGQRCRKADVERHNRAHQSGRGSGRSISHAAALSPKRRRSGRNERVRLRATPALDAACRNGGRRSNRHVGGLGARIFTLWRGRWGDYIC